MPGPLLEECTTIKTLAESAAGSRSTIAVSGCRPPAEAPMTTISRARMSVVRTPVYTTRQRGEPRQSRRCDRVAKRCDARLNSRELLDGVLGERASGLSERVRPFRRIHIAVGVHRDA